MHPSIYAYIYNPGSVAIHRHAAAGACRRFQKEMQMLPKIGAPTSIFPLTARVQRRGGGGERGGGLESRDREGEGYF